MEENVLVTIFRVRQVNVVVMLHILIQASF